MKFSAAALKWTAMVTMLIDHTGLVLCEYLLAYKGEVLGDCSLLQMPWEDVLYPMAYIMRMVGRISFPLYCFLLTEGFLHTRDWKKYWLRLMSFALISEIPFSLAAYNTWIGLTRNVFFELAAGILMLQGFRLARQYYGIRRYGFLLMALGGACAVAVFGRLDYGAEGMLMIGALYLLKDYRAGRAGAGGLIAFSGSWDYCYGTGALAAIPMALYSGEKGRQGNRYVFYWFYPLHLLALFLIRRFVLGVPLNTGLFFS